MKGVVAGGVTAALCILASACAQSGKDQTYACPSVFILQDAKNLTRFRPGLGRDITDIQLEAEIIDFQGQCDYGGKDNQSEVSVQLLVQVHLERGPANRSRAITFEYFVVLPSFEGNAGAKQVFPVRGKFEERNERLVYRDEIDLKIPLKNADEGPLAQIVIGFQLTQDELNYNRLSQRQ